ncbi:MAG: VTT domain-containing protein [Planctomycetota bacterium]
MNNGKRILLWLISLLVVCIIPVLLFSEARQDYFEAIVEAEYVVDKPWLSSLIVVGLFAGDIFLPIPSTAVCAVAGKLFGTVLGSLLCWLGLNISSAIGYGLGWFLGFKAIRRFSSDEDVRSVQADIQRWGIWSIIGFRPLPILAEASVLMLGAYRYPFRQFWPPILVANLLVATCFVGLGSWFADKDYFFLGLVLSCGIPLVLLCVWVWIRKRYLVG